jgi:hypothetical protein
MGYLLNNVAQYQVPSTTDGSEHLKDTTHVDVGKRANYLYAGCSAATL